MTPPKLTVLAGDFHVPFHDTVLLSAFTDWLTEEKRLIEGVVINGDLCDMYQISKYAKNPERRFTLRSDMEMAVEVLRGIRNAVGRGKPIAWLGGNHEDRLRKFKWNVAPELYDLESLSMENMFHLDKLDVEYREPYVEMEVNGFYVMHGDLIRQHSAYSARALVDRWATSVVMNHSHRFGAHYHTFPGNRIMRGYENGCMCKPDPEYIHGTANWQMGWGCISETGVQVEWIEADYCKLREGVGRTLTWRGNTWAI